MLDRFFDKVSFEPNSGCWLWTATVDSCGYGLFGIGGSGNTRRAHRVSYELFKEPIKTGLKVCHKCDTPSCVNPDHLFCGTDADNMKDRDSKQRTARGVKNGKAKLDEMQVAKIRGDLRSERTIAAALNISRGTVNAIRSGRTWKHI
jgi:hypothetical protein